VSGKQTEAGFTLIEVLIVVAIIAILAAIAIPQFASYRTNSANSAATADLNNIMTAEELYYTSNQTYVNLTTIAGYQASLISLPGIRLSTNVCAKVINASATNFTVQTESLLGDKSYTNSQSSILTTTSKIKGSYSIGC